MLMKKRRTKFRKFVVLIFGLIILLPFLALVSRFFFIKFVSGHFVGHLDQINGQQRENEHGPDEFTFVGSGADRLTKNGLHDRFYAKEKSPGVFRIAMIGDSFMYGTTVTLENTLPKQLEALLNRDSSCPVEVINFGMPGLKLAAYAKWIKTKIRDYHPDLIVFELAPQSYENDAISSLPSTPLALALMPLIMILNNTIGDKGDYQNYLEALLVSEYSDEFDQQAKLNRLKNECRLAQAQCLGLAWPIKLKRHLNRFRAVHDWTIEMLEANDLKVVAVWDSYAAHPPKKLNASIFDPHPTAFANSLVARAVANYLREHRGELGMSCPSPPQP